MKNVRLILLLVIAILFLGIGNVNAQENTSNTIIIRVTETPHKGDSRILTVDMEGMINIIELEKGWKDELGNNAILIQKEIVKWKQKGYKITHLSTSGASVGDPPVFRTTIILEK